MKANTCLLLLIVGWFILGLPIGIIVGVSSVIQLSKEQTDANKLKYGISIVISLIYIVLVINTLV